MQNIGENRLMLSYFKLNHRSAALPSRYIRNNYFNSEIVSWYTYWSMDIHTCRLTYWLVDWLSDRLTDWLTDGRTDKQTDDRQIDRLTDRHTEITFIVPVGFIISLVKVSDLSLESSHWASSGISYSESSVSSDDKRGLEPAVAAAAAAAALTMRGTRGTVEDPKETVESLLSLWYRMLLRMMSTCLRSWGEKQPWAKRMMATIRQTMTKRTRRMQPSHVSIEVACWLTSFSASPSSSESKCTHRPWSPSAVGEEDAYEEDDDDTNIRLI